MKHLYKNIWGLGILAAFTMLFSSCEQDPQFKEYVYPMPEVTEISPSTGYVASQLVIRGMNFGDRTEPVKVFFGGVQATEVLMCKNNRISVKVPENALSGDVTLQVWTNEVGVIGQYTVLPTPIFYFSTSPNSLGSNIAAPGETVTIKGDHFGDDKNQMSVSFNGTPAASFELVDSETITAVAPEGYESGSIIVTIHGYDLNCGAMMNPSSKGDVTIFYLKNYKYPFRVEPFMDGQSGWGNETGWFANPTDWTVSPEIKCMVNKNADASLPHVGGTVKGYLGAQAGWGGNGSSIAITDGKIYQTMTLPAGDYDLDISFFTGNVGDQQVYAVLATGDNIPKPGEVATDPNVKWSYKLENYETVGPKTKTISFTLDETTRLTIGFAVTVGDKKYFEVSEFKLTLK